MTIKCIVKNIYGKELIYPACDKAKLFAEIAGTKTLSMKDLKNIGAIGFYVEFINEVSATQKLIGVN